MHADQAKAVAEVVGQQIQYEWMMTVRVIEAIPEDKKDYKPDANARSAWELAVHLAESDVWFLEGVLKHEFGAPDTSGATTIAALATWYKQHMPARLERVLAMEPVKLAQIVDFFGTKTPSANCLVTAAVHGAHHRGQLTTYLRPMGSKVPAIYGGSFDEPFQG